MCILCYVLIISNKTPSDKLDVYIVYMLRVAFFKKNIYKIKSVSVRALLKI